MKHRVLFYWLVLLVSVLAIGGAAFYLLRRERDRLSQRETNMVKGRGQTIVEKLGFLVDAEKSNLINTLADFSDPIPGSHIPGLEAQMTAWKGSAKAPDGTSYAQEVFLYRPNRGLVLPPGYTQEQRELEPVLRTADGRWIWDAEASPTGPLTATQIAEAEQQWLANIAKEAATPRATTLPQQDGMTAALDKNRRGTLGTANAGSPNDNQIALNNAPNPVGGASFGGETITPIGSFSFSLNVSSPQNMPINFASIKEVDLPSLPDNNSPADGLANFTMFSLGGGVQVLQSQIGQNGPTIVMTVTSPGIQPSEPDQGWTTIGPVNDLRWLGWFRPVPDGPVRGAVLNWQAMKPNLLGAWPLQLSAGEGFVLRDPSGKPVVGRVAGNKAAADGSIKTVDIKTVDVAPDGNVKAVADPDLTAIPNHKPLVTLGISEMPGWTLDVYYNPPVNLVSSYMLGTMMLATLVVFVVVGGTLLMREARREAFDASRKTTFVSNVSHELKTPLTTIRMYAELLGEGRVRDPGKQRNYLTTIIGESQRLTRLVNNVLDFSRLEQGHKKYSPDNLSLADVVEGVVATQRPRLDEAGFACELRLAPDAEIQVRADRDALEQVLLNLLDNALKYAAEGRWIGVTISNNAEQAILTVSDHGAGVPSEHRERIFEMFHRVDDAITAKQPGTGLGLSIARRLLRDQGGDLRYEPNKPCGASFVATIPLAATVVPFEAEQKQA